MPILGISASQNTKSFLGPNVFAAVARFSANAASSTDGITWTQRTLPSSLNWYSVAYGGGVFVAVAYSSTDAATSTDGITWTQRTLPLYSGWKSVAYGGGVFVAVTDEQDVGGPSRVQCSY